MTAREIPTSLSGFVTFNMEAFMADRQSVRYMAGAMSRALEEMIETHPCDHPAHLASQFEVDCPCCEARLAVEKYERWEDR